jgi:hypothetical protein
VRKAIATFCSSAAEAAFGSCVLSISSRSACTGHGCKADPMGGYFQTDDRAGRYKQSIVNRVSAGSSPDSYKGNARVDGDWVTFVVLQLRNAISLAPIAALA